MMQNSQNPIQTFIFRKEKNQNMVFTLSYIIVLYLHLEF